jgi:ParB family chromosome partitioning protein
MADNVRSLPLSAIVRSSRNPRKSFDQQALEELAASISEVGVIQPIVVVRSGKLRYRIVAGERRWRAAKMAGLKRIPAVVRELKRTEIAKLAFIENLQRRDLSPVEEANAIEQLIGALRLSNEAIGEMLGKSASYVYGRRRLLEQPKRVLAEIEEGRLSPVAALSIARLKTDAEKVEVALASARGGLTVGQVDALVRDKLSAHVSKERSSKREETYNRKLRDLRKTSGKQVVAYNEFDSSAHQRVWNLRFKECGSCELKGVLLTRDMRQEDLCVVATCYRRLEHRERTERLTSSQRNRGQLGKELEKLFRSDEVQPAHLQLVAFVTLELLGSAADDWRSNRGLPPAHESKAPARTWEVLGALSMDGLVTSIVELSAHYLNMAGEAARVPAQMMRDLSVQFGLNPNVLRVLSSDYEIDNEAVTETASGLS